jgi:hypothetical protein
MLHHALSAGVFSARKQLLFCVGVCRLRGEAMPAEYLPILDDLEAFADSPGLPALQPGFTFSDWEVRHQVVLPALQDLRDRAEEVLTQRYGVLLEPEEAHHGEGDPRFEADDAVLYAILGNPFACCRGDGQGRIAHSPVEADLLREVIGSPFRRPALDRAGLTPTVLSLARSCYDDRAYGHLPILADALEEAGGQSADLLGHCRGGGPHARGCWALDLILA